MENASLSLVNARQQGSFTTVTLITVVFLSIIIILTISGNFLVLCAFCQFRKLRTPAHYFIASLALSDLLVGMITIPMWLSFEITRWQNLPEWIDVFKLVDVWTCIDIICSAASISNLLLIGVDRCVAVTFPLWHRNHVTRCVVRRLIFLAWLYAVIPAAVYLQKWEWKYIVILFLAFVIPLMFITSCYLYIILVAKRKKGRLQSDFKIAKTFGIVTGTFILTWMPFFVWSIVIQYCGQNCRHLSIQFSYNITSVGKVLHYSNSCFNPVIYAYYSRAFQEAFNKLVRGWSCRNSEMTHPPSLSNYRSFRSRFNSILDKNSSEPHNKRRRHSENIHELKSKTVRYNRRTSTPAVLNNTETRLGRGADTAVNPRVSSHNIEFNSLSSYNGKNNTGKNSLRRNGDFPSILRGEESLHKNTLSNKGRCTVVFSDHDKETNV